MFTASRYAALSVLALAVLAPHSANAQDPAPKRHAPRKKPKSAAKPKPRKPPPKPKAKPAPPPEEEEEKKPEAEPQEEKQAEPEEEPKAETDEEEQDDSAETEEADDSPGETLVTIDDGGPSEELVDEGEAEEEKTIEEGEELKARAAAKDREAAAVEALWSSLRGASLKKRILTYEAFVKKYPDSRYAVPLWEEAQSLRELVQKRAEPDMPPAPPRPIGAAHVASEGGLPSSDEPSVDFDDLEERYERLQKLKVVRDAVSADVPEPEKRDARIHDGGFIRLGFGPQWFNGSLRRNFRASSASPNVPTSVDVTGFGLTAEFVGGGAPVPGFIIAARVALTVAMEPEAQLSEIFGTPEYDDPTLDDMIIPFTGIMMDVYPDPELGIHFFGTVGITMAELGGDEQVGSESFVGVGYGGGIGFEGWVADEWSIGVQARVDAAHMFGDENDATTADDEDTFVMVNPTVQLAFTFN